MEKSILLFTVLAGITLVFFTISHQSGVDVDGQYEAFIAKYRRNYATTQEYNFRKQIFEKNLKYIEDFNSQGKSWTLGVNNFADMTKEEVKKYMGYVKPTANGAKSLGTIEASSTPNDEEIDWKKKGFVNKIKNQGSCGSCWAFAANAGVEAAWKLFKLEKEGKDITPPNLSEQMLVDCDMHSAGCMGGFMNNAYYLYTSQCPVFENDYKYKAKDEDCKAKGKECATDLLLGWYDIKEFDDEALRHALNVGVVPVAIEAENEAFYLYTGGVISGEECGYRLDHGVGLVGEHFETTANGEQIKVWDIRNSWGTGWGEDGYVRIQRETIRVQGYNVGVCGINQANSIPAFMEYWH